jgi:hypothetical protein
MKFRWNLINNWARRNGDISALCAICIEKGPENAVDIPAMTDMVDADIEYAATKL